MNKQNVVYYINGVMAYR